MIGKSNPQYIAITLIVLFTSLLSLWKSNHCRLNNFSSPDRYTHICYSDFPALFSSRALDTGSNPYSDPATAMEYPVGTGYIAATVARFSDSFLNFFDINALLIIFLFLVTTFLIFQINSKLWYLFPLAPAVISSLFINWDIWAILPMVASLYYLKKGGYHLAGLFLGISIAIKFFSLALALPIFIYFLMEKNRSGVKFFITTFITVVGANIYTAIYYYQGWLKFFQFNSDRGVDFGSIWYGIELIFSLEFGPKLNLLSIFLTLASLIIYYYFLLKKYLKVPERDHYHFEILLLSSFATLMIIFSLNKVYSPQYVLWLSVLATLVLRKNERFWFWLWQVGEGIYHLAIWQYLAAFEGGSGLSEGLYALSIVIRIAFSAVFVIAITRARLTLPSPAGSKISWHRENCINPPVVESPRPYSPEEVGLTHASLRTYGHSRPRT